jgi:predicted transcriptional regulator
MMPKRILNIQYGCNLSYDSTLRHLKELVDKGFIRSDPPKQYVTTERGKILMDTITQATSLLSSSS